MDYKIQLAISCSNLPNKNIFGTSDPQIRVSYNTKNGDTSETTPVAQETEIVDNDMNPWFLKKIEVPINLPLEELIHFELLYGTSVIGECFVSVDDLLTCVQENTAFQTFLGGKVGKGQIFIIPMAQTIDINLRGTSIKKANCFKMSNPFCVFRLGNRVVYKTEIIQKTKTPAWEVVKLPIGALGSASDYMNKELTLEVFNWNIPLIFGEPAPKPIAEIKMLLNDVTGKTNVEFPLTIQKSGKSAGIIIVDNCQVAVYNPIVITEALRYRATLHQSKSRFVKISCTDLINKDLLSKSDPKVIVNIIDENEQFVEVLGETETKNNNLNPNFRKARIALPGLGTPFTKNPKLQIEFNVVDVDNKKATESLGRYVLDQNNYQTLLSGKPINALLGKKQSRINLELDTLFYMIKVRGWKLKGKDLLSKSDPYIELYQGGAEGEETNKDNKFYKSEFIDNNHNPAWNLFELSTNKKNTEIDPTKPVTIKCWDKDTINDDLIGTATFVPAEVFTVGEIIEDVELIQEIGDESDKDNIAISSPKVVDLKDVATGTKTTGRIIFDVCRRVQLTFDGLAYQSVVYKQQSSQVPMAPAVMNPMMTPHLGMGTVGMPLMTSGVAAPYMNGPTVGGVGMPNMMTPMPPVMVAPMMAPQPVIAPLQQENPQAAVATAAIPVVGSDAI